MELLLSPYCILGYAIDDIPFNPLRGDCADKPEILSDHTWCNFYVHFVTRTRDLWVWSSFLVEARGKQTL